LAARSWSRPHSTSCNWTGCPRWTTYCSTPPAQRWPRWRRAAGGALRPERRQTDLDPPRSQDPEPPVVRRSAALRSGRGAQADGHDDGRVEAHGPAVDRYPHLGIGGPPATAVGRPCACAPNSHAVSPHKPHPALTKQDQTHSHRPDLRSEEHTSELQ